MQEEINEKTIALMIRCTKLTGELLKKAIQKLLPELEQQSKLAVQKLKMNQGRQSVKQLIKQGTGVSNIEIADQSMKQFQKIARKYGLEYAIKKDNTLTPPKYLVFFKSRDADAMTAAFREFTAKTVQQKKEHKIKPSILLKLHKAMAQVKNTPIDKSRSKEREETR